MFRLCWRGDGQVHQVIVGMDPHVQDRLQLHLFRLGIIGQHLLTHVKRANGLFSVARRDQRAKGEATAQLTEAIFGSVEQFVSMSQQFFSPFEPQLPATKQFTSAIDHIDIHDDVEGKIPKRLEDIRVTGFPIEHRLHIVAHRGKPEEEIGHRQVRRRVVMVQT